jgi:arsenate reductase
MTDKTFNVLFLCTGNSARSIMAEALLNALGGERFRAFSAGSRPTGTVNPFALKRLTKEGIAAGTARSKSWQEFARPGAPPLDFVITVCDNAAGEVCPAWPGQPITAHWGVPDPAASPGSENEKRLAFAKAFAILHRRISLFASLNPAGLERLALERKVREIGHVVEDERGSSSRAGGPLHSGAARAKQIEIYEPALCCSTGVCGVDVDQRLVNFAADVDWAKQNGVRIERFNLAQQPMAFAENLVVRGFLESSGQEALPLVLADGERVLAGRYPTRAELARWAAVEPAAVDSKPDGGGCCSGSRCC